MERFWSKVKKTDGCWEWTAARDGAGYGYFKLEGECQLAHRVAYRLARGSISEGAHVCHHCDNPGCVNPDHLFLGTHQDNMDDKTRKGRAQGARPGETHHLAKLTEERVREIRQAEGTQQQIAIRFGISRSQVSNIRTRRQWKHI
jgi:hypothetical protein